MLPSWFLRWTPSQGCSASVAKEMVLGLSEGAFLGRWAQLSPLAQDRQGSPGGLIVELTLDCPLAAAQAVGWVDACKRLSRASHHPISPLPYGMVLEGWLINHCISNMPQWKSSQWALGGWVPRFTGISMSIT